MLYVILIVIVSIIILIIGLKQLPCFQKTEKYVSKYADEKSDEFKALQNLHKHPMINFREFERKYYPVNGLNIATRTVIEFYVWLSRKYDNIWYYSNISLTYGPSNISLHLNILKTIWNAMVIFYPNTTNQQTEPIEFYIEYKNNLGKMSYVNNITSYNNLKLIKFY